MRMIIISIGENLIPDEFLKKKSEPTIDLVEHEDYQILTEVQENNLYELQP